MPQTTSDFNPRKEVQDTSSNAYYTSRRVDEVSETLLNPAISGQRIRDKRIQAAEGFRKR